MDLTLLKCLRIDQPQPVEQIFQRSHLPNQCGYFILCRDKKPLLIDKCYNLAVDIPQAWQRRLHSQRLHTMWNEADCIYFQETSSTFEAMQLANTMQLTFDANTLECRDKELTLDEAQVLSMQPRTSLKMYHTIVFDTSCWHENTFEPPKITRFAPNLLSNKDKLLIGLFSSTSAAKKYLLNLIKQHNLCMKLLGLESTNNKFCFARKLQSTLR